VITLLYRARKHLKRKRVLSLFLFLLLFAQGSALGDEEQVKIKILAVNPDPYGNLETKVTYFLPKEVSPVHVLDTDGMEISYSQEEKTYYVFKEVTLAPKETQKYIITVKNVWFVDAEAMGKVREQIDKSINTLSGTKFEESIQLLSGKVLERLNQIEEAQGKDMGIKHRIELFHAHQEQLADMENEVMSLSALRRLEAQEKEEVRTAKFTITAENPSSEARKMTIRSILPKMIKAVDVLDSKGFTVVYDRKEGAYTLDQVDKFEPKEVKKYEIVLRDVWFIPDTEMQFFKEQTNKVLEYFKETKFKAYSEEIASSIFNSLDSISTLQDEVGASEVLQDRIRAFILNQQRFELAKKKFREIQDLMLEVPLESKQNVLEQVKESIQQLTKLLDILTVGFEPDLSTTWWLILGVIGFVGCFATSFYVIWIRKVSETPWGEKTKTGKAKESVSDAAETSKKVADKKPDKKAA
jgi:hypothetical protein